MKKLLLVASLLMSCAGAHAYEASRDVYEVRYKLSVAANTSTAAVVIDLSDTTNWPHRRRGSLIVQDIQVKVDKVTASSCTVKLGVVSFVNDSSGTVKWFYGVEQAKNVGDAYNWVATNGMTYYNLLVQPVVDQSGATPLILTNDVTTQSTVYQRDVPLPSPSSVMAAPGVGDCVISVANSDATNSVDVYLEVHYFAQ